ncbi:hypothetical protein ASC95_27530 [Pelomonas sp. Root1217]|uniref:hypothetical protein n=1 Tax=Pelomonas sp. Root1217 TaxID=1736430 RepID=UPI000709D88D|nr:hypothetical protein [Pelomonas sp. Root1217]KQV45768.1 hypothetical protein ASC95_27530 [Pelomonas sp. Root1217]
MRLAFFPWIRLDEPMTLGDVRLIPYFRKARSLPLAHIPKADVDAIFKAYADRPGKAVQHGVIVEVADWHSGTDMPAPVFDRLWQVKEILTLSALASRHLFVSDGSYVNSHAYALVVQNFTAGSAHGFAFSTRRRDGVATNFWSSEQFAFQRPLHVSDRWRVTVDVKLAEALLALPVDDPILEAIREFNAANTDSGDVAPHVEIVMVKSAFEWLLGIDEKRSSLSAALTKLFPAPAHGAEGGPLRDAWLKRHKPSDQRLLSAWVADFCVLRGSAAHGKGRGRAPTVWDHFPHLAFASILFPLLVKKVLAERGLYRPSDRDNDEFAHIEDYLEVDPRATEDMPHEFAWSGVRRKLTELALGRGLHKAILDALNKTQAVDAAPPTAAEKRRRPRKTDR